MVFLFASCGLVSFLFIILLKKDRKLDTAKTKKTKMQKKETIFSVSAVMFTNSVPILGGGLKKANFR